MRFGHVYGSAVPSKLFILKQRIVRVSFGRVSIQLEFVERTSEGAGRIVRGPPMCNYYLRCLYVSRSFYVNFSLYPHILLFGISFLCSR